MGLSGGLDSTVLLHLVTRLDDRPALRAVHVNHQLNPSADDWEAHCRRLCAELGVPLECRRVEVRLAGRGPEAAAREARYRVFAENLAPGEALLLAHHLDDQVETFFLRLLRGAGPTGLAGMPAERPLGEGVLVRPLLDVPRADLQAWAQAENLDWCEDDSNRDERIDRNYLRNRVLPLLADRWPGYRGSVATAAADVAATERLLREDDRRWLAQAQASCFGEPVMALDGAVDEPRLAHRLRTWLAELGMPLPGRQSLLEFIAQCQSGDPESHARLLGAGYELQRHGDHVHLTAVCPAGVPVAADRPESGPWMVRGVGTLALLESSGSGLRRRPDRVGFRTGGERCRPAGRANGQTLKKLLQEYRVPHWWRDRVPLLYCGDSLAAVGDLWICEGWQAQPGEPGWQPDWQREPPGAAAD